jgi:hypothetical protein
LSLDIVLIAGLGVNEDLGRSLAMAEGVTEERKDVKGFWRGWEVEGGCRDGSWMKCREI